MHLPDDGKMLSKYENTALSDILAAIGGIPELKAEINFLMSEASCLRNGIPVSKEVQLEVGNHAIVAKMCFEDGICWAAKMYENRPGSFFNRAVDYGTSAATLVQRYCPDIPINTSRGCGLHKLKYCFTHWIEGDSLSHKYFVKRKLATREGSTIAIPPKTVTSLAEFVYNLTTCPIPETEMTKMKRDDFKDYLRVPEDFTVLEAANATDWAKHQFWTWYLFSGKPSVKPYDGLDFMLLLGWVTRMFSGLDELPFVLHYWDLRMPNIIVDERDNLLAIIDWDNVAAVPINLAAISISDSFWRSDPRYSLNKENAQVFQTELSRMEKKTSRATNFSQMLLDSRENMFLSEILLQCVVFRSLRWRHPETLSKALQRSSENMEMAASLWAEFSNLFYTQVVAVRFRNYLSTWRFKRDSVFMDVGR